MTWVQPKLTVLNLNLLVEALQDLRRRLRVLYLKTMWHWSCSTGEGGYLSTTCVDPKKLEIKKSYNKVYDNLFVGRCVWRNFQSPHFQGLGKFVLWNLQTRFWRMFMQRLEDISVTEELTKGKYVSLEDWILPLEIMYDKRRCHYGIGVLT